MFLLFIPVASHAAHVTRATKVHLQQFFFSLRRVINFTSSFLARRITLAFPPQTIDKLPDKVLLRIFSYLSHREIINNAFVCKRWRTLAYNTNLWDAVSFRPDRQGLCVNSIDTLLYLIG